MQVKTYDRSQAPQHLVNRLKAFVQSASLCAVLAELLNGLLDPEIAHRLTAEQLSLQLQEVL